MRDEGRMAEADKTKVRASSVDERRSDTALRATVGVLLVAVGLVVCLASANVANLLLASAIVRRREIGTRLAIGASRLRLVRQLLTESLLLGIAAGMCGLVLSMWLAPLVASFFWLPPSLDINPDWTVFTFVAMLAIVVGVVSGL